MAANKRSIGRRRRAAAAAAADVADERDGKEARHTHRVFY
jgi:hypothetical protein